MSEQPPARKRKRTIEPVAVEHKYPPTCDPADIFALQAVYNGRADATTQRRAMDFIIQELCSMKYHPAGTGPDAMLLTFQAIGRQHVGRVIVDLLTVRINPRGEQP